MLLAIGPIDYGVLALYLLVMVAIGFYFSRQQHTSKDFFLAGRSMGWFPVGLSIMATLLSALSYSGVPGASYYAGFKFLLMPISVWVTAPLLIWFVLPLYHHLGLYSIYDYLEMRFDAATRFASSLIFIVWRLFWLGGVLFAPCKVLVVAAGLDIPLPVLIVVLGLVSTGYTFLGGMKAVIWTDVIQSIVMVSGVVLIVGCVWWNLDGGASRVWEIATSLGRTQVVETKFDMTEYWSFWGFVPHIALSMLSFYIADQITAQRYLTAKSLKAAQRSFTLNCVSISIMIPALMYLGVALLAYYHDHPQDARPDWVVNLDAKERTSLTFNDRDKLLAGTPQAPALPAGKSPKDPLLDWKVRGEQIDETTIDSLVQQQRILRPNNKLPFADADEIIDPRTNRVDVNKLAMRSPPKTGLKKGEIIFNKKSQDELMPYFITKRLSWGMAGLILAALFAASMSSMDSGLNSICTLFIMDFHRRLGWGREWLARRVGKSVEELNEADELKLGRPLVLVIGVAATAFSLIVGQMQSIWDIMVAVVNTFGGPLMSIFLLGMFTRRTTARSALAALVSGTLFTFWLAAPSINPNLRFLTPFPDLNGVWPLTFGVVFTLIVGYLLGLFWGRQKSKEELRGLTIGCGPLGIRQRDATKIDVSHFEAEIDDDPDSDHWK